LFAAGLPVTGSVAAMAPAALAEAAGFKAAGLARLLRGVEQRLVPGSRIIAVAGSLGLEPGPHDAAPGTANAALINLMRQVAQLYGPRGVLVHTLAPGPLDTPRLRAIAAARAAERDLPVADVLAEYAAHAGLGVLPSADDLAWLIDTLLAPQAAILHGAVIGGRNVGF
jgi:NAD(P)-dependent dehydrogenase (short-subunit alcohol dehydrogenase family)